MLPLCGKSVYLLKDNKYRIITNWLQINLGGAVLLDPNDLARAIAEAARETLPDDTLTQLAWALANHQGVALNGNDVYVVLGDPLAGDDTLTVLKGCLPTGNRSRKLRPAERVMDAFRTSCGDIDLGRQPSSQIWLPEIEGEQARAMVGGALPPPEQRKAHDYTINWYRLADIPAGALFYFFYFRSRELAIYQQITPTQYALLTIPQPQNIVTMSGVVAALANGQEVTGIATIEGSPTLMRTPRNH
jgi:hypothetical protein